MLTCHRVCEASRRGGNGPLKRYCSKFLTIVSVAVMPVVAAPAGLLGPWPRPSLVSVKGIVGGVVSIYWPFRSPLMMVATLPVVVAH